MGSQLLALGKMLVCLALVLLVACGGTWTRAAGDRDIPADDLNALVPTASSKDSPADIRVEESLLKTEDLKQGRAVETDGAVNYQIFQKGKGTKKEPEKPKKEVVSRLVDSNYLVYEIKRSDGSLIFVPII